jgi:hypothetical protein
MPSNVCRTNGSFVVVGGLRFKIHIARDTLVRFQRQNESNCRLSRPRHAYLLIAHAYVHADIDADSFMPPNVHEDHTGCGRRTPRMWKGNTPAARPWPKATFGMAHAPTIHGPFMSTRVLTRARRRWVDAFGSSACFIFFLIRHIWHLVSLLELVRMDMYGYQYSHMASFSCPDRSSDACASPALALSPSTCRHACAHHVAMHSHGPVRVKMLTPTRGACRFAQASTYSMGGYQHPLGHGRSLIFLALVATGNATDVKVLGAAPHNILNVFVNAATYPAYLVEYGP